MGNEDEYMDGQKRDVLYLVLNEVTEKFMKTYTFSMTSFQIVRIHVLLCIMKQLFTLVVCELIPDWVCLLTN